MDFYVLAEDLRAGRANAERAFAGALRRGVELILARRMPCRAARELAERLLWRAASAVRRGEIAEPVDLVRFVHAAAGAGVAGVARDLPADDSPTEEMVSREHVDVLKEVLAQSSEKDMEALRRFYVNGENLAEVLDHMKVSAEEFCRLKARLRATAIASERRPVSAAGRRLIRRMAAG